MRTPFDATEAFRRFGYSVERAGPGEEDVYTKALLQEQGFDGLPQVVTRRQLDAYVAAAEPELYRGIAGGAASAYAKELREGNLFIGHGAMGGGVFAAGGTRGLQVARNYAEDPGSVVVRMAVKRGARVVELGALVRQMAAERAGGPAPHATREPGARATLTLVPSVYAAYLGYDVVVDRRFEVWLVLNRTALRIQDKVLPP
jgi:hypothetical protein